MQICELIVERFGGSNTAFALAIGKSPSQVGHWISGHRNPNGDTCREVEDALDLPRGWLDGVETPPAVVAHGMSYQADTVPHLTREELMQTKELPEAFWVELLDDALAPKLPKGTVVRFTRNIEPAWGNVVLLRDTKGELHVRVHTQDPEHKWRAIGASGIYMAFTDATAGVERLAVLTAIETRTPIVF